MATITIKKDPNYREVPFGGNDGDILKKVGDTTSDQYEWSTPEAGAGSNDYNDLDNKPSINGTELLGDRSLSEFGIDTITAEYVQERYDLIEPQTVVEDDWKIDYNSQLKNHPEINSVELIGNKSLKELGIYSVTPDDILRMWEEEI